MTSLVRSALLVLAAMAWQSLPAVAASSPAVTVPIQVTSSNSQTISSNTTIAAPSALTSWSNGTGFPAEWTWNASYATQPAAATSGAACGAPCTNQTPCSLTVGNNCIEQWRGCTGGITNAGPPCTGGSRVATWGYIGAGLCTGGIDSPGTGTAWSNDGFYAKEGCGVFGRAHWYRLWQPGDVFYIFPAAYDASADANQPMIMAQYDNYAEFNAGITHIPTNLTFIGVTVSNTRPTFLLNSGGFSSNTLSDAMFYIQQSAGTTFQNFDVDGTGTYPASLGNQGAIYVCGANGASLIQMRVHDFVNGGMTGITGCNDGGNYNNSGQLTFDQIIDYDNGGQYSSGNAAHGVYIANAAALTLYVTHSYFYGMTYGHLFKSRNWKTTLIGNFFQGGLPIPGQTIAESCDVDYSNGGQFTAIDNIFFKNNSGVGTNGISINYAAEGVPDARSLSIDIENNTFVAFANAWGTTPPGYAIFPMQFYYPGKVPGSSGFPVSNPTVKNNLYVGYYPRGVAVDDYRGTLALMADFTQLSTQDNALIPRYTSNDSGSVVGQIAYQHQAQPGMVRTQPTIGAEDGPN